MTMENPGYEGTKPTTENVQPPVTETVPNPSRRRFNRAGVGASAVVMTLASRSVLANVACTTASGFTSLNQSSRGAQAPVCNGGTPEVWMATANWPDPKNTLFSVIFGDVHPSLKVGAPITVPPGTDTGSGDKNLKLRDATIQQALFGSETPLIIKYLIAALLNADSMKNAFPTRDNVVKIFQDWNRNTSYEVMAGLRWNTDEIIKYLKATQTPGTAL